MDAGVGEAGGGHATGSVVCGSVGVAGRQAVHHGREDVLHLLVLLLLLGLLGLLLLLGLGRGRRLALLCWALWLGYWRRVVAQTHGLDILRRIRGGERQHCISQRMSM